MENKALMQEYKDFIKQVEQTNKLSEDNNRNKIRYDAERKTKADYMNGLMNNIATTYGKTFEHTDDMVALLDEVITEISIELKHKQDELAQVNELNKAYDERNTTALKNMTSGKTNTAQKQKPMKPNPQPQTTVADDIEWEDWGM